MFRRVRQVVAPTAKMLSTIVHLDMARYLSDDNSIRYVAYLWIFASFGLLVTPRGG